MKKSIITLLLLFALVLAFPINAFADVKDYAVDNGNLLNEEEEGVLSEKLQSVSEMYNFDIVALTIGSGIVDSESDAEAYADDYYDEHGYNNDGCLLLISADRYWHISTKGYGITAITDYGIDVLEEEVVRTYFSEGDYSIGFYKYADLIEEFLIEAKNGAAYDVDNTYTNKQGHTYSAESMDSDSGFSVESLLIALVVAAVIAAVIALMVKSSYKPVRFSANAADYLVDGSLHLNEEYDRFLYSNVTKTKIETESSSKGGSSTHTSSSGSSHGGGGGRF